MDRTARLVVRLAEIMRYMIYECMRIGSRWTQEIEFIRNYIEIEKLRHQVDIRLTGGREGRGAEDRTLSLYLLYQNGFKHAMDHTSGTFIYITCGSQGQLVRKRFTAHARTWKSRPRR